MLFVSLCHCAVRKVFVLWALLIMDKKRRPSFYQSLALSTVPIINTVNVAAKMGFDIMKAKYKNRYNHDWTNIYDPGAEKEEKIEEKRQEYVTNEDNEEHPKNTPGNETDDGNNQTVWPYPNHLNFTSTFYV